MYMFSISNFELRSVESRQVYNLTGFTVYGSSDQTYFRVNQGQHSWLRLGVNGQAYPCGAHAETGERSKNFTK